MKAIILSGGSGVRLRPLTAELPKPMVPLLGAPLLEHSLRQLRRRGITQVALTLHYLSEVVEDYFGEGRELGMELCYYREEEPLGTAGAVRACLDFVGEDEDVLVLSGDALWNLDLDAALDFHRRSSSAATLILHRSRRPLEYGLVRTGADGRITGFIEKPGWGQVFTDQVNTGIYLLRRSVLEQVPTGKACDFARDLFPRLLEQGMKLSGYVADGYWKDIGDCGAYLQAVRDALEGKVELELEAKQIKRGIWCASQVPKSTKLIAPCYISEKVSVGECAVIGPYTVLEPHSRVERGAVAEESVLMGAALEAESRATGAILCPESAARRGAVLNRGTVLGPRAVAATHSILRTGARLWPDVCTQSAERVNGTLTFSSPGGVSFGSRATLKGVAGEDITAELLLMLGGLLAEAGVIGLGYYGGAAARSLVMAAAAGVTAAGGTAVLHDATTPASAAWLTAQRGLKESLFVEQRGEEVGLRLLDCYGLPLSRERQRGLESGLLQGVRRRLSAHRVGEQRSITGADADYVAAAAAQGGGRSSLTVHVPRRGRGSVLLREALAALGAAVQTGEGPLSFSLTQDGTGLWARDEKDRVLTPEQCFLLTERIQLEGEAGSVFLPPDAPAAAERMGRGLGKVLPLEENRGAAQNQRCLRDGTFAACRILDRISRTGESLAQLADALPECVLHREELALKRERSTIMRRLTERFPDAVSTSEGLRISLGEGSVFLSPRSRLSALKITAEAKSAEAAEELCVKMREQVRRLEFRDQSF